MAALAWMLLLFTVFCIIGKARAEFGIVDPFPENIYPIEFSSAEVTCVAADPDDPSVKPSAIKFMRKSRLGNYVELTPDDHLYFTNKTEEDGSRLLVTMFIANVTTADDSIYGDLGRYECHAFADGVDMFKHGFSVNVITKSEIPTVVVPEPGTVSRNDDITLTCNMTERGNTFSTVLTRISWFKDGEILQTVRNPDPSNPEDTVGPLELKEINVRDGGTYLCLLQIKLRNIKPYNVTAETTIHVAPWIDKPKEDVEVKKYKGKDVTFQCVAQGFPLEVEWKIKKKGDDAIQACINSSTDRRYIISRSSEVQPLYKPYELNITELDYTDRGMYYCCLPSQCSDNVETDCQRFILRIRDPLGPLWPVIGIIIEAILLFLIIFFCERRKHKKERAEREDGRIEFSYSSTDDGERGQVRLRKTGEGATA